MRETIPRASVSNERWEAKVDGQMVIACKLSELASNEYLEDILQHAKHVEVGFLLLNLVLTMSAVEIADLAIGRHAAKCVPYRQAATYSV